MAGSFQQIGGSTIGVGVSNQIKILQKDANVSQKYSFEFGNYLAQKSFYNEMSRIQNALVAEEPLTVGSEELNFESAGDLFGWQQYLQGVESAKKTLEALGSKGLKAQNASLSSHR
jgi:hypothetical protein